MLVRENAWMNERTSRPQFDVRVSIFVSLSLSFLVDTIRLPSLYLVLIFCRFLSFSSNVWWLLSPFPRIAIMEERYATTHPASFQCRWHFCNEGEGGGERISKPKIICVCVSELAVDECNQHYYQLHLMLVPGRSVGRPLQVVSLPLGATLPVVSLVLCKLQLSWCTCANVSLKSDTLIRLKGKGLHFSRECHKIESEIIKTRVPRECD